MQFRSNQRDISRYTSSVYGVPACRAGPGDDYLPYLDGLRAVSIVIVLLSHFRYSHVVPGSVGVTLFFVISGFIITRTLYTASQGNLRHLDVYGFYARRIFRLTPALMFYLLAMIGFDLVDGVAIDWPEYVAAAAYQHNYAVHIFAIDEDRHFGHLWSLAVEEHFYLLFPWLLVGLGFIRKAFWIVAAVTLAIIIWRMSLLAFFQHSTVPFLSDNNVYRRSDTRFDSILAGVLLSLFTLRTRQQTTGSRGIGSIALTLGLSLVVLSLYGGEYSTLYLGPGLALQGAGIALGMYGLIFTQAGAYLRKLLSYAPAVWLGKISYSLYIWHVAVFSRTVVPMNIANDFGRLCAAMAFTLVAACISYYLVERPIRAWGRGVTDRWLHSWRQRRLASE